MKKIKAAISGLGRIAYLLEKDKKREKPCTHVGTYLSFPNSFEIIAGHDINPEKKDPFCQEVPQTRFYDTLQGLLENEKPDILSIATPAQTHYPIFQEISRSKYHPPLIWLEKPVELNLKRALKIKKIKDQLGIEVLVNHERRFHPQYRQVKEIIENMSLGDLKTIYAVMWNKASTSMPKGSGTLLEDGTHLLDIIFFWLNQSPTKVKMKREFFKSKKVEKRAYGLLEFDEIKVFLESGGDREYFHFELDLSFTKGRIKIGNGFFEVYKKESSPYYENFFSLVPQTVHCSSENMFLILGKEIIGFFDNRTPLSSTLENSLEVMKLIHKIY